MAHTLADDYIEAEPLLGPGEQDDPDVPLTQPTTAWSRIAARFQARNPSTIVLLLTILMFAITTSGMMFMIPIFRIVEDAFCHVYYEKDPSEPIDERLCKVDAVQGRLAFLGGVGAMVNSFVGLVTLLPYGILADR